MSAVVATNAPLTVSNVTKPATGMSLTLPDANNPVEREYQKLRAEDDAAQAEVDKWLQDNNEFSAKGAGIEKAEMSRRIHERFEPVKKAYDEFLKQHPDHARAHIAYGSFLGDLHDE